MLIRLVEFANWENGKYLRNILQRYTKHKISVQHEQPFSGYRTVVRIFTR